MWKTLTTRYFIPPVGSSPIVWGVIMSIVLALPSLSYPICGQTVFLNRHNPNKDYHVWVDGSEAVAGMFFYIFVGLTLHFTYYRREKPALERFSPILSNISVITWFSLAILTAFS